VADFDALVLEDAEGSEGQVIIDITPVPDQYRESVRDRLVAMFTPVIIRVKDANGNLMPYGVEEVECKICASLIQRKVGPMLTHATRHESERRARRAPKVRR
jgi:hypothetical protein